MDGNVETRDIEIERVREEIAEIEELLHQKKQYILTLDYLEDICNKIKSLEDQKREIDISLRPYLGLPPDLTLAKHKLMEAKNRLMKLNDQWEQLINQE